MCGHDDPTVLRVGARVDLFSGSQDPRGNLIFLDPSEPDSQLATHVRFTPEEEFDENSQIVVSIQ